jgi:hypothetical protein
MSLLQAVKALPLRLNLLIRLPPIAITALDVTPSMINFASLRNRVIWSVAWRQSPLAADSLAARTCHPALTGLGSKARGCYDFRNVYATQGDKRKLVHFCHPLALWNRIAGSPSYV